MPDADFYSDGRVRDTGPPPLRIHHILVATLVAAVLLSVHESLRKRDALGLATFFKSAHGITYTLASALNFALLLFGLWWRGHGRRYFHQPGHWLILVNSLSMSTFLFAALAAVMGWEEAQGPFYLWTAWFLGISLMACAINFRAAVRVADTLWWRSVFFVAGSVGLFTVAAYALGIYGPLYAWGYVLGGLLATMLLIFATIRDLRSRRLRDWAHWSGVVLELVVSSVAFVNYGWQLLTRGN